MKETPLLFTGAMVRALLEGRKTQTRRIAKFFCETESIMHGHDMDSAKQFPPRLEAGWWKAAHEGYQCQCPYGKAGDRLWGRETFFDVRPWRSAPIFAATTTEFIYRADYEYREKRTGGSGKIIGCHPWKPSIFMPREASRLLLEVTQVRVHRLQGISDADSIAEGILECWPGAWHWTADTGTAAGLTPRDAYRTLWNSINLDPKPVGGRYEAFPWSIEDFIARHGVGEHGVPLTYRGEPLIIHPNPYVWAISFRKIQP